MRRTYSAAILIVLIFLMMAGCATYGALEEDYGNSYRLMKTSQTLNPAASKNQMPVVGISSSAVEGAVKKYNESFAPSQTTQQAPMGQIPLLSTSTSGMGQDAYGKK